MSRKFNNNLLDAESAVADFLDVLLKEATEQLPAEPPPAEPAKVLLMPDIELTPAKPETGQATTVTEKVDVAVAAAQPLVQDRSSDYQFPLQCLMFYVGAQQLSIPLIDLGSVLPLQHRLTRLPDTPDWFLGILQHRGDNVKVVDTAEILHIPGQSGTSVHKHLIVFGDDHWAISCDRLGEVLKLQKDDVKWSSGESSYLTLGTIRDSLAILLDPDKIIKYLSQQKT